MYLGVATLAAATVVADAGLSPEAAFAQRNAAARGAVGWDTYRDVNGLTQLRGGEQSRQFSSFARDGSNNDGFQGTFSCLRTWQRGCVIAEHSGPGEISSIWFTREPWGDVTGTGNIVIELDGRVVLDRPLIDVVTGRVGGPFQWPLVGNADDASGGAVIKVPMPYRESMRVTVQNNPYFYHVNTRTFPDSNGVQTFNPADGASDVLRRLRGFGVADPKPSAPGARPTRRDFELAPGASVRVAELSGPAQINQLRVRLPQVLASPQVVDDGMAYGQGGGSRFRMAVHPGNQGIRVIRRYDPQIAYQVARMNVDGVPAGEWRSGAAAPGAWGVQIIEVPPALTAGKSSVEIANQFLSSSLDVNEFRYDVHSKVNGEWVRTDVLDLGPAHPGEEAAHGYRIDNPVFARSKLVGRYGFPPDQVAASDAMLETTRVRITFDGRTTVDAPIGEFFGTGLGEHDVRTMMSSVDPGLDGWYTAWWPMPFSRNATVEIVNTGGAVVRGATAEVVSAPMEIGTNTGYFHATHRRAPTTPGQDWTFVDAKGAGTFYGVTHTMRGLIPPGMRSAARPLSVENQAAANQRNYLEGDERFYVNGSSSPAWHGTGSEDYYEAGWYFRDGTTFSMPLAGNPSHELNADGCRYDCTGAYRLMVPDAVPFADGLLAGIEHGPLNDEPGDYSSVAYWYGGHPAEQRLTDEVDLADPASRDRHGYRAQGEAVASLNATYEGGRNPSPMTRATTTATGPISFDVAVDANGEGVRLRRLGDQQNAYQAVDVRIDGQPAGRWLQPLGNPHHRWLEDEFDVAPGLTDGKQSVRVELFPVQGAPAWSASKYSVYSR
ncbi:glycoside hydrolase family 172 protein [Saccharopolyspora erythraea]|uniref:DUF2961 family protein n=2 Tax=Saccharopolyspora erythraea TaxID=1836 RepID=A4F8A3_SACEN|nr:glycoside hydrolase family 172 protein [Saccharopolyspora erythraea]QRK90868.1 DUF2961 domain-containing protein [Saccharopolyspora erythraea]CAM00278.1 hypothetical protein SACE_0944 [Saccharopolyspora erythraea NRRL 2338]